MTLARAGSTKHEDSEKGREEYMRELAGSFSDITGEFLLSFKHPDFREEREWRLVYFHNSDPRHNRGVEMPKFRSFRGNVIPYLEVSFARSVSASREDTLGIPFPIADVRIGPTIAKELNRHSIRLMILKLNPDVEPHISKSEIPLRWL